MTDAIEILPAGPINGSIRPPGSKSLTNRALVCAALAKGESILSGVLDSEDTRVMAQCLSRLGIDVRADRKTNTMRLAGCNGRCLSPNIRLSAI
ncbi:MAG: 3-phosphoshikimate 1-carboxyvinyltransferase, partial [Thermoguttaceae bacterium]